MEMDVSKYKGIKKFTIWIHHTNAYSLNDGSFIGLYDFDNNLISSKSSTNDYANTIVEFTKILKI